MNSNLVSKRMHCPVMVSYTSSTQGETGVYGSIVSLHDDFVLIAVLNEEGVFDGHRVVRCKDITSIGRWGKRVAPVLELLYPDDQMTHSPFFLECGLPGLLQEAQKRKQLVGIYTTSSRKQFWVGKIVGVFPKTTCVSVVNNEGLIRPSVRIRFSTITELEFGSNYLNAVAKAARSGKRKPKPLNSEASTLKPSPPPTSDEARAQHILEVLRAAKTRKYFVRVRDREGKSVDGYVSYVNPHVLLLENVSDWVSDGFSFHRLSALSDVELQPSDALLFWVGSRPSLKPALPFKTSITTFEDGIRRIAAFSRIVRLFSVRRNGRYVSWEGRIERVNTRRIAFRRMDWDGASRTIEIPVGTVDSMFFLRRFENALARAHILGKE